MSHRLRRLLILAILVPTIGCGADVRPSVEGSSAPSDASHPAAAGPDEIVWLAAREIEQNDVTAAIDASLVRDDGSVAWSAVLPMDPAVPGGWVVAGPRSGRLVYGTLVEGEMVLRAVDATDGSDDELLRVREGVVGADLDPRGETLYLALSGDEDLRIVHVPLSGGEPSELHREPNHGRLVLTLDRLHVTPDGRRLVFDRCIAEGCSWLVLDVENGAVAEWRPDGAGSRIDISNDTLLASTTVCAVGPCPFLLVNLETGEVEEWAAGAHNARLGIDAAGATLLLFDQQGLGEGGVITVVDPADGREETVEAVDRAGMPLGLARQGQDTWVPSGWEVLALPGTNLGEVGGPVLLRLDDGSLVHLPAPAPPAP